MPKNPLFLIAVAAIVLLLLSGDAFAASSSGPPVDRRPRRNPDGTLTDLAIREIEARPTARRGRGAF